MTFKVGDTVQLKSGGPKMTVTGVGSDFGQATVWCAWFDGTMQRSDHFPIDAVRCFPEPDATNSKSKS
ncbi:MAG: DUF2158 domain-containing protein [Xanthobacteraceae bacterium]